MLTSSKVNVIINELSRDGNKISSDKLKKLLTNEEQRGIINKLSLKKRQH
ncbi:MAG: hypothetical protein SPF70_05265 [Lachnospiraceae bacterium]|nr:hypothetical protein [Lachnospiraceae bacterium]